MAIYKVFLEPGLHTQGTGYAMREFPSHANTGTVGAMTNNIDPNTNKPRRMGDHIGYPMNDEEFAYWYKRGLVAKWEGDGVPTIIYEYTDPARMAERRKERIRTRIFKGTATAEEKKWLEAQTRIAGTAKPLAKIKEIEEEPEIIISKTARDLAESENIPLDEIEGKGQNGAIRVKDVQEEIDRRKAALDE
jgi:pyruvate/2-oxoglutarate dehydrogenase complex dihydrolipoamide acyltransferase (E2) component